MKITINISKAEYNALLDYLKAMDDEINPTRKDVVREIEGLVSGNIQSERESYSDYLK